MKRVAFAAIAGILLAAAPAEGAEAAAEPPPALELIATTARLAPGAGTLLLVIRRDDAVNKAATLHAPAGASLWPAGADGVCSATGGRQTSTSLDLAPGAANPAFVCFSMGTLAAGVRVVATVSTGSAVYSAATPAIDIAEPPSASLWDKPGVSVVLSALVGFLFGLGSSWLQVWFESWKEARVARSDAEKFIANTLFPELREHATTLAHYLAAEPAELRRVCALNLKVPQITTALTGERLLTLSKYFASVSLRKLKAELTEYDKDLTAFNRWADRLRTEVVDARDPGEQRLIAQRLHASLIGWKIA